MKTPKTKRSLLSLMIAASVATGLAVPGEASAAYVCSVMYNPVDSIWGDDGYVHASYYNGPACTGGYLYSKTYCSANANTASCASSPNYTYDADGLRVLHEALRQAAAIGQSVVVWTTDCFFGSTGCGSTLTFYAN